MRGEVEGLMSPDPLVSVPLMFARTVPQNLLPSYKEDTNCLLRKPEECLYLSKATYKVASFPGPSEKYWEKGLVIHATFLISKIPTISNTFKPCQNNSCMPKIAPVKA